MAYVMRHIVNEGNAVELRERLSNQGPFDTRANRRNSALMSWSVRRRMENLLLRSSSSVNCAPTRRAGC